MKKHVSVRLCSLAVTLAAGVFAAMPARADISQEPLTTVLPVTGSAGLGFVTRIGASPYRGGRYRYDVLPLYLYEGERFFLHANRGGVKLLESEGQRLDVFVEKRLEGFAFDRLPAALAGMAVRESGYDAGLSWRLRQPWGLLQAELLHNVDGTSKGSEARLVYSYDWRSGRWLLRPSASVAVRDARLNNYYYGVQAGEARPDRAAYAAGAGVNTSVGLYGAYDLSQGWRVLAGVSATLQSGAVADSPVVQKRVLPTAYLGVAYDFGAPRQPWADADSPTYFKVLYGRATGDGCHLTKIITARCLSLDSANPTSIAAVQVGKPFAQNFNGWPVDIVGYAGLTHHNDRGLQANGIQLDLYMKAFYFGFPWSERVKTRAGMGAGVSLAQRVPYNEASSQAASGKPTSRLMQYLNPTLDVSLGDLVGSRALKATFVGVGVSHRSGIFGVSRALGNVYGGSDYLYTYLETAF